MPNVSSIKIRMYRHGFGDCFLLQFFARRKRTASMLIDCGLKRNDSVDGITLQDVADDIRRQLKGKDKSKKKPVLDVLVATHEHWDHVSGFHPSLKLFDDFNIQKIWMAWTENPKDDEARQINSSLRKRVKALRIATERIKKSTNANADFYSSLQYGGKILHYRNEFQDTLDEVISFFGPLGITKTKTSDSGIKFKDKFKISIETQNSIDHLRKLSKGDTGISYFEPGDLYQNEHKFPGIRIFVLGPPKSALLNKDHPSSGAKKEVYFGSSDSSLLGFVNGLLNMDDAEGEYDDDGRPFIGTDTMSYEEAKNVAYYNEAYFNSKHAWRKIDDDWLDIAGALALQMDSDTNNTSLVLAIEFTESGKVLLFPGDAQVGNWLSWHDVSWNIPNGTGTRTVTATDLLKNTVFYKVGHHASHNATLKEKGLELMKHEELVAFVPEKEKQYNGIPYKPLLNELRERTKGRMLISADRYYDPLKVMQTKPDQLSTQEWKNFKNTIEITPLYIEYTLPGK